MSQTYDVSLNPEKSIIIETEISGGTTDYERLKNLPSINGVELKGNLSTEDLKIELPDTSDFATKEDLETKADKSEIPDVKEFATKIELEQATINKADKSEIPDVSEFATKSDVENKADKSEIPTIPTKVSAFENDAGYLTEHQDISGLATKDELNDYALKADVPTKTSDLINDSDFITSEAVKNTTKMLDDEHKNILLSNGTYDGKDVEDGFVFTSPDGKLVGFDKTLNPGGDWGTSTRNYQEYVDSRGLYGKGVISISALNAGNVYSIDKGRTWSYKSSGLGSVNSSLGPKNAAFNGVSFVGLKGNSLYTSDDGISWIYKSGVSGIPTGYSTTCFECGNGVYVTGLNDGKLYYSSDYTNWTEATQMSGKYASCTCFANDKFVAVTNSKVYLSENGADWVETSKPSGNGQQCAGGNGIFVISDVGSWTSGSSNKFFYSTDGGLTWKTSYTASSRNWCGLTWCGDRFFAVAHKDNLYTYSFDGINWIEGTMPQWDYWSTVTYADGEIVVTCGRAVGKTNVAYASFHPFYEYSLTDLSFNKAEAEENFALKSEIPPEIDTSKFLQNKAQSADSVELGSLSTTDQQTVDIGYGSKSTSWYSVGVGYGASAYNTKSVSVGHSATSWENCVSVGYNARSGGSSGASCVAIGANTYAKYSSVVIGCNAKMSSDSTTQSNAVLIGYNAQITGQRNNTIAIGANAITNSNNSVQMGAGTNVNHGTFQFRNWTLVDANGNVPAERLGNVPKTTISELTAQTTLANNAIFRANEMSSVELLIPETIEDDFICEVDFTSGETATAFTMVDTVKWTGDDITEGAFVPVASKRYNLIFWYDGVGLNAVSRGVE